MRWTVRDFQAMERGIAAAVGLTFSFALIGVLLYAAAIGLSGWLN